MLFVLLSIALGLLITIKELRSSASIFCLSLIIILAIVSQAMGYSNVD